MVDIELSRDEDSVTSLAVAQSSQDSAIVLAGINSSTADQQAGRNEHLRSFKLEYPHRKTAIADRASSGDEKAPGYKGRTTALGRASLFNSSSAAKKETYQRVLRLSPARKDGGPRLGAAATGLAPEGEIVLFDCTRSSPQAADICGGITLAKGDEAADVDIIEHQADDFRVAYCTDYEVYQYSASISTERGSSAKPRFLYGTPHPDTFSAGSARPTFRAIRFLTPKHLLLLQNAPGRSGAELLIIDILESGGLSNIIYRKRLHKSMKAAIGLDVAILPPDSKGVQQMVVAVAGQDISIELLTIDYSPVKGLSKFRLHSILRNVHPLQLTKITFSHVQAPAQPTASDATLQYLKLASVSMGNTVVVHTLPLTPFPFKSKQPRYVLIPPGASEAAQMTFSVLVSIIVVALGAFFIQAFTEIRGGTPPYLGATNWLSPRMKDWIARPYMLDHISAPVITTDLPRVDQVRHAVPGVEDGKTKLGLRHLLKWRSSGDTTGKTIMVRNEGTDISAEVHDDKGIVRREAKRWEDLEAHEREGWKRKLIETGDWVAEEGEVILKGVFFGEIAGAIGQAFAGA